MGVLAALLALFAILLVVFRNEERIQNPIADVQMLSFLWEKPISTDRNLQSKNNYYKEA